MNLGENIKKLRKERRMTLVEVAEATDIDVATLSRIENGKMTGTIQSHLAIAKALHVHLPELYEQAFDPSKGAGNIDDEPIYSHGGGSISEILATGSMNKKMMPVRLTLKGLQETSTEQLPIGTERFVYCLTGKIKLTIRDRDVVLTANESLYFTASVPHQFKNQNKTQSCCLILTGPPSL